MVGDGVCWLFDEYVAALRKENQTRKFWTICCCRRAMTSGFFRRSKVHYGPHPILVKMTTSLTILIHPMTNLTNNPSTISDTIGTKTITQHDTTTVHCLRLVERVPH